MIQSVYKAQNIIMLFQVCSFCLLWRCIGCSGLIQWIWIMYKPRLRMQVTYLIMGGAVE